MTRALPSGALRVVRRVTRLDFIDGLGISVGQRHVALAHLVKRLATVTLAHHGVFPLPPLDQAEARRTALAAAIAGFLAGDSIGADRTFVSLPRGNALLSRLPLPMAAQSDLRQVVEFEIDRLLPVARDEVFYDFLMREVGSADKLEVQVIAALRRVVTEHLAALELAGVRARGVTITPVALLDLVSFASRGEGAQVVALVDDGGVVELDLFAQNRLRASHLVRPSELVSPDRVERLISEEAAAAGLVSGSYEVYAWRSGSPGAANGETTVPALPEELLSKGPDLIRRLEGILAVPDGFFTAPDPALGPAIGAALGAVREGDAGLNLLPAEERRAVEEGAPVLTFLFAAVLVLVTLVWLVSAMIKDHRVASQLHEELASLEPGIRAIHKNEDETKDARDKLRVLTQGDQRRIAILLRELTEVIPDSAYISTFRVRNDRVELEGFAKSASDLVPLLEKSKHFKNAQFTSPVTKVQNNQERFSLTTEIEE